jgi:polyisoprenoid-binding protein YceI
MTWVIDTSHTTVEFAVRHLGLANVKGTFHRFSGEAEVNETDLTQSRGRVEIEVGSVDTREEKRDAHLRSADFFDADNYPTITFESRTVRERSGLRYEVDGDLTIHGVTRPVTLDVELSEFIDDPWGNRRAAVSVSGEVNRKDFGLTYGTAVEAGRLVVGDRVKIQAEAELVQVAAVAA